MRNIVTLIIATGLSLAISARIAAAEMPHEHASKYAGQEKRTIKSLSADDIAELRDGRGWGLAKAAELNGVPGPVHLLEAKNEIGLTAEQTRKIQALFDQMKTEAIALGNRLIAQEFELEKRFQTDIPGEKELASMLDALGATRARLRFVHLVSHLKTLDILTGEQVASYNQFRGYAAIIPCADVPKGHDPEMWKRHNRC